MPRHVRNFWVEGSIDGRETELSGGPRSKDGGLRITLYQRDEGEVEHALTIRCWQHGGMLTTQVTDGNGRVVFSHETVRDDARPRYRVHGESVPSSDAHVMQFGRLTPDELDARIAEVLNA